MYVDVMRKVYFLDVRTTVELLFFVFSHRRRRRCLLGYISK